VALLLGFPLAARAQTPVITTPPGRKCAPAEHPEELPGGNQLVDSLALSHLLSAPSHLLLTVRFEQSGQRASVNVLESDQDAAITELLRAGIERATRVPQPGSVPVWAVRLRLTGGPVSTLTIEQSVFCQAAPRGGRPSDQVTILTGDTAVVEDTLKKSRPERRRVRLTASLQISAAGEVQEVILDAGSGRPESDEEFIGRWKRLRFYPALLDGFPVAVTYDTNSERSSPR